jgi:hypothetical protein
MRIAKQFAARGSATGRKQSDAVGQAERHRQFALLHYGRDICVTDAEIRQCFDTLLHARSLRRYKPGLNPTKPEIRTACLS